jgi:tetratricopeptide (TPR) repeat protein
MYDAIPMMDSQYYDKVAREIAEGDILGGEVFYMAPLYPYMMAIPYRLFRTTSLNGNHIYNVEIFRYIQCTLGAMSCILIYWIGTLLVGRWGGFLAGLMAAVYGVFIYHDGIIMPSTLILFLDLLAFLILVLAARYGSGPWWLTSGVFLGLCVLAHGTALLLFLGVLVWIWLGFPNVDFRTKRIRSLLLIAGFIPIVSIVTLRNYVVGKDFVLLTSNVGKNLYIGNNPSANGSFKPYIFNLWGSDLHYYLMDKKRTLRDPTPSESSRILVNKAIDFMLQHPLQEIQLLAKKFRLLFIAVETGINDNYYFAKHYSRVLRWALLSFGLIGPVGLTGLVYSIRKWRKNLLLLIFVTSQVVSFTIVFVLGRYRLVLTSCLMIFAAAQIVWWFTQLRQKQYRQVVVSLLIVVLFSFFVYSPMEGFDKDRGLGQQYAFVGTTYLRWRDFDKAKDAFQKAVTSNFDPRKDPHHERAICYINLGQIYERQQNWLTAVRAYENALLEIGSSEDSFRERDLIRQINLRVQALKGNMK